MSAGCEQLPSHKRGGLVMARTLMSLIGVSAFEKNVNTMITGDGSNE